MPKRIPLSKLAAAARVLVLELNEEEAPAEVGPYGDTEPGSARQVFESHLHEIAHHVTLYDRFASVRATIDIVPHGQGMPKPLGVTIGGGLGDTLNIAIVRQLQDEAARGGKVHVEFFDVVGSRTYRCSRSDPTRRGVRSSTDSTAVRPD